MNILSSGDVKEVDSSMEDGPEQAGHTVDCTGEGNNGLFPATTDSRCAAVGVGILPEADSASFIIRSN